MQGGKHLIWRAQMREQQGFTYLGVLFAVALLGLGLVAVSEVWVATARRQQLAQLHWVGVQYARAIASYYEASPKGIKVFPKTLDDLLEDRRFTNPRRHLRQLYADPMTGEFDWELMMSADGRVIGVMLPERVPLPSAASMRSFPECSFASKSFPQMGGCGKSISN